MILVPLRMCCQRLLKGYSRSGLEVTGAYCMPALSVYSSYACRYKSGHVSPEANMGPWRFAEG